MKNLISVFIVILSVLIMSCSKKSNPVADNTDHFAAGGCSVAGLDVNFRDTCSYNFAVQLLKNFDSVKIIGTQMGSNIYIYADSGDYNYWQNYFKGDSSIRYVINISNGADSLILKFQLLGTNSIVTEQQRFSQIKHLKIIKIEEEMKTVGVSVPKGTEEEWKTKFLRHSFVSNVFIVMVCTDI